MKVIHKAACVTTAALLIALGLPSAAGAVPPDPIRTVASGFAGPLHVAVAPSGHVYVADAFVGQIARVNPANGHVTTLVQAAGFSPGVDVHGQQIFFTVSSEPEAGLPQGSTTLMRTTLGGSPKQVADMLAYELAHNPDGQPQQLGDEEADSVSNPYSVLALPGRTLVGDAGANDIIEVRANGAMRTLVVFPVSHAGECATATNNGVPNGGCDPVPTDMAMGPDGYLYVSGLGAEVEGFLWKVNATTGQIVHTMGGFPPLTGVAVADDGTIFAASLVSSQVFRLHGGNMSVADVPGPSGLDWANGILYAGSVDFGGGPGSLLAIMPAAFHPVP